MVAYSDNNSTLIEEVYVIPAIVAVLVVSMKTKDSLVSLVRRICICHQIDLANDVPTMACISIRKENAGTSVVMALATSTTSAMMGTLVVAMAATQSAK